MLIGGRYLYIQDGADIFHRGPLAEQIGDLSLPCRKIVPFPLGLFLFTRRVNARVKKVPIHVIEDRQGEAKAGLLPLREWGFRLSVQGNRHPLVSVHIEKGKAPGIF